MKGTKFFGIGIALAACVLALLLVLDAGFISAAWAGKPPQPPMSTKYGYAMFRDESGVIKSDGKGQYKDCHNGGEDYILINVRNKDGFLNWVEFYPGKMSYHYPTFPPSTRRVNFHFNVSNAEQGRTGNAVLDILRWYKDTDGVYKERCSTNPGFLNDNSLHAPIMVHEYEVQEGDVVQFVVDPGTNGTDPKAITQTAVDAFYADPTDDVDYLDTSEYGEAGQIIYFLNYGVGGFDVTPVQWDRKKKPITWKISATSNPKLYVKLHDFYGDKVELVQQYPAGVPFEFAVSLNPLTEYPAGVSGAPRKDSTLSTTWGEIKAR